MKVVRNSIKSWKSIQLLLIPLHTRRVTILWAGWRAFKTWLLNLNISGLIEIELSFSMVSKSPFRWVVRFFALSLDYLATGLPNIWLPAQKRDAYHNLGITFGSTQVVWSVHQTAVVGAICRPFAAIQRLVFRFVVVGMTDGSRFGAQLLKMFLKLCHEHTISQLSKLKT